MLLFGLVAVAFIWMHVAVHQMERKAAGATITDLPEFPEMEGMTPARNVLVDWRPEDSVFWRETGAKVATRNLSISIPCLLLAFAVWMVWSVVVAKLPSIGFDLSTDQLFWLAALPGLSGATLRIFYSFMVPIFGGRLWTTLSTLSLLIPAFGIGYAVQSPDTPYVILLILALLCGLGGGNFSSSMANISFFFPKRKKGSALALNAGLGNLGVSVMQFAVPIVITFSVFGVLGGAPQQVEGGEPLWLQNAGFIWVPFILISAAYAWFEMHDIPSVKASFAEQAVIFQRKHNWIMCVLYTGTFGSFIGYSAGFPLLAGIAFPDVNVLSFAFLGPLVGAASRAATGRLADKVGGGRVSLWVFVVMIVAVLGVIYFLGNKDQPGAFWGFFAMFMLLFLASGVGNASTFQMIPVIMRKEIARLMPDSSEADQLRHSEKESAAIIGFTSAIAAYGAFFIPKSYGTSIQLSGGPEAALWCFLVFYGLCAALTWHVYTRPGGLLYDVERANRGKASLRAAA
jgi:NNP family nitrate/nitrite transporter-like MFS transporter